MAKLIEKGTNYAYTIERIKDITFTKLRSVVIDFTRRLPADLNSELYEAIQHGVCQLQSEPELNMYIHALGLMHEAKLQHAFEHLPSEFTDYEAIEIIDYGCGQAIGTICYADFLRKNGYAQEVRRITLIEPSEIALKRAALHVSCFFPNAEIITINKGFDDLVVDDLCIDDEMPILHIFSNVIDLADDYFNLEKFAMLINDCARGENHYICIEPYFDYEEQDEKLRRFSTLLDAQPYYSDVYLKGAFVEGRDWTCCVVISKSYIEPLAKSLLDDRINHIKNCTIKEVSYTDNVVNITLTNPIKGYVSTANGVAHSIGIMETISMPLYYIVIAFKKDEDWGWLGNTILSSPFILNRVLKGATIDIIQQYIFKDEEFVNPLNETRVYNQDTIINSLTKVTLAKRGEDEADKIAELLLFDSPIDDIELIIEFADDANKKKQYKDAFGYYKLAAEQGCANAQFYLGRCYNKGKGVEKNYIEAIKWWKKAAEQGVIEAQFNLGICYANGQGVEQDQAEAVKWYRRAAELGDRYAQFKLANHYHKGEGVTQNDNEAIKWYIKAAEQGDESAEDILSNLNNEIKSIKHYYRWSPISGYGYSKDIDIITDNYINNHHKDKLDWITKVAQYGYSKAQHSLGMFYDEKGDYVEAVRWYRKAADQGHAGAQYSLGWLYQLGKSGRLGVKNDISEAVKWYRKAAEQGNSMAQRSLAYCYIRGKGVKQDYDEAIRWFVKEAKCRKEKNIGNFLLQYCGDDSIDWITKVAENGYATAQHKLGSYYESGYKIEQSYERAAYWYKKAFDNGALEALISLANIKEVVQDYEEAMSLYCEAVGLGNEDAKYKIAKLYAVGKGVEKSDTEVIRWLKQYRHTGSGFYSIGELFYDGTEIAKSYEDAIKWWKLAADENHAYAKYMLGICYENGEGVEQSYEEAAKWYKKSIDTGCIEAKVSLGRLYEKGYGVVQSYEEAIKLYNAAAEYKNIKAMCCLGDCYRYGLGVKRSYNDTVKWYKMASKHYGKDAQEAKMLLAAIYEDGSWNLLNKILFQFGFLK